MAIEVVDRLAYDFADSNRGARMHAVRVATFDAAVRRFPGSHPAGTVVALGEGLETRFWRLDNCQARWLTVDLPETMDLRHRLLPEGARQSSHRGSALEPSSLFPNGPFPALVPGRGWVAPPSRAERKQPVADHGVGSTAAPPPLQTEGRRRCGRRGAAPARTIGSSQCDSAP
jgi:Leucine carboxyl methyltransferase